MQFDISYRDGKTGKKEVLQIEAPSKADVWTELKARKISPISISESKKRISVMAEPCANTASGLPSARMPR